MPVRIIFSTSPALFSKLIRFFTWSDFSHVEFVTPDGKLLGADALKGVILTDIDTRISHAKRLLLCEFDCDEDLLWPLVYAQLGKPYDWGAVFGMLLRRDWQALDKWFCSELIIFCATHAKALLLSTRMGRYARTSPRDLVLSPALRTLSEDAEHIKGIINDKHR